MKRRQQVERNTPSVLQKQARIMIKTQRVSMAEAGVGAGGGAEGGKGMQQPRGTVKPVPIRRETKSESQSGKNGLSLIAGAYDYDDDD